MPGFVSLDDLITEHATNGNQLAYDFYKTGPAANAAGTWTSLWTAAGAPVAGGAINASPGQAFTDQSGSINFNDVLPNFAVLTSFGCSATTDCSLQLVDRLVAVGSITLSAATTTTTNTTGVPRYVSSSYTEAWLEVTTATTTRAGTVNMTYTDETGAGQTGPSFTLPISVASSMYRFPVTTPSKGVISINTVVQSASPAPAAGVAAAYIQRPLATIPLRANVWNEVDFVMMYAALPRMYDGASLCLQYLASATTATNFCGSVRFTYG